MSDVGNDLIVDIFERLPLKSIIRFRSLSKYWRSRIASREFIHNHRLGSSQQVLIRHLPYCGKYKLKDIYTLHPPDQLPLYTGLRYIHDIPGVEFPHQYDEVVGSHNGILCLRSSKQISLWNFSIRRRLILPRHPSLKISSKVALGFGFDPIIDDYKIVGISYAKTYIYSLKTESWSEISSPSTRFYEVIKSKPCLVNGILHWLVDGYLTKPSPSRFILTFNLNSHDFGHILLPEPWTIRQLTTIDGCLALVSWVPPGDGWGGGDSWIWVMKEYGKIESWMEHFRMERDGKFDVITVFQPTTNGDILVHYDGSLFFYPQTRVFRKLMTFGPCCSDVGNMEPYVESLELLDKESATACGETVFSWREEYRHFASCFYS